MNWWKLFFKEGHTTEYPLNFKSQNTDQNLKSYTFLAAS